MGYDVMPTHEEIKNFASKLAKEINYKILDEHKPSAVVLLGEDKDKMRIKSI